MIVRVPSKGGKKGGLTVPVNVLGAWCGSNIVRFPMCCRRSDVAPGFSGHVSRKLPSLNSKCWKAVKSEVTNNELTDTYGGSNSHLALIYSAGFNVPRRLRGRGSRAGQC